MPDLGGPVNRAGGAGQGPQAAFEDSTCISALVTDRAVEAWYHPCMHE
jgi:hypothetical protein